MSKAENGSLKKRIKTGDGITFGLSCYYIRTNAFGDRGNTSRVDPERYDCRTFWSTRIGCDIHECKTGGTRLVCYFR